MKAVLLATGLGHTPSWGCDPSSSRRQRIAARPMIDVVIESFVLAGFDEVGVVLHDNQTLLQRYLEDGSRYGVGVYTMRSENGARGRAASILAARVFVGGESFVLASEASRLDPSNLQHLTHLVPAPCALAATRRESARPPVQSRLRLRLDAQDRVERAGDDLYRWNAVADDVFLFHPDVFQHVSTLLQVPDGRCSVAQLLCYLIQLGLPPQACLEHTGEVSSLWAGSEQRTSLPMLSVLFSPEYLAV